MKMAAKSETIVFIIFRTNRKLNLVKTNEGQMIFFNEVEMKSS